MAKVVRRAEAAGLQPLVWFDGTVGYRVCDCWLGPIERSKALIIRRKRALVAGKGHPADPFPLEMASQRDARVITNDRFRDWVADFLIVTTPEFRIHWRFGSTELELAPAAALAMATWC